MLITGVRPWNSQESVNARCFLEFINAEHALILSMLADAGDETDMLVRLLDTEAVDPSMLAMHTVTFLDRIYNLFINETCRTTGYTAYMLKLLSKERLIVYDGKPPVKLGFKHGVLEELIATCLVRMKNWAPTLLLSDNVFILFGLTCCN